MLRKVLIIFRKINILTKEVFPRQRSRVNFDKEVASIFPVNLSLDMWRSSVRCENNSQMFAKEAKPEARYILDITRHVQSKTCHINKTCMKCKFARQRFRWMRYFWLKVLYFLIDEYLERNIFGIVKDYFYEQKLIL